MGPPSLEDVASFADKNNQAGFLQFFVLSYQLNQNVDFDFEFKRLNIVEISGKKLLKKIRLSLFGEKVETFIEINQMEELIEFLIFLKKGKKFGKHMLLKNYLIFLIERIFRKLIIIK